MSKLLEKAFSEAAKLDEREQDVLTQWILDELASERQWDEAFEHSQDVLAKLADEALAEFQAASG